MDNTVLVLGARGRLGGAVAQAFAAAGWRVLAQRRAGGATPPAGAGIEWVSAEAADTATLQRVAAGARVVVHAMNPAYTAAAWRAEAPGLMQAAINIAAALGARLLFPGNVYNFGAGMPALLAPGTPQRPTTGKGRIRIDLEQQLAQAARQHGFAATVIRAGDFFGAGSGSWLDQVIVKKLPQGRVTWPGALEAPHAWACLPDLVSFSEDDCTIQLGMKLVVHMAFDSQISELLCTKLVYAQYSCAPKRGEHRDRYRTDYRARRGYPARTGMGACASSRGDHWAVGAVGDGRA